MKKLFSSILLFSLVINSFCQEETSISAGKYCEFRIGLNYSDYFTNDELYTRTPYDVLEMRSGKGFLIESGFTNKIGNWPFRLGVSLENFKGDIRGSDGNTWPGHRVTIDLNQTNFNLLFDPLVINFKDLINLNFGMVAGFRIYESTNSILTTYWVDPSPFHISSTGDEEIDTSKDMCLALRGSLSINIPISKKLVISPRYSFSYLTLPVVNNFYFDLRGTRHNIDIGIKIKRR